MEQNGFEVFYSKHATEVKQLASELNWHGHGSSLEYDIMLLPDGPQSQDAEDVAGEYLDALRTLQASQP